MEPILATGNEDGAAEDVGPWAGKVKEQTRAATKEVLEAFAHRRKIKVAVKLGLPQGEEALLDDPAFVPKKTPTYVLPKCDRCQKTVRHHSRCRVRWSVDLKPYKE